MYYKYFTFKGLNYTRNIIVFSFIFLQIFFQRNIFRKLRITVVTSSQWNVASTFWVIWGNVRCRLMNPLIFGDYTKIKIITRFILHFSKMFLFRLLCLEQFKDNITVHWKATVYIWCLVYWTMKNQWNFIPDLMKLFSTLYFSFKIYLSYCGNSFTFFLF